MCTVYVRFAREIMDLFLDGNLLGSLDLDLFQDSTQLNPAEGFAQCKTYTLIERERTRKIGREEVEGMV